MFPMMYSQLQERPCVKNCYTSKYVREPLRFFHDMAVIGITELHNILVNDYLNAS